MAPYRSREFEDSVDLMETLCNPTSLFSSNEAPTPDDAVILESTLGVVESILASEKIETPQRRENKRPNDLAHLFRWIWDNANAIVGSLAFVAFVAAALTLKILNERGCGDVGQPVCTYHNILGAPAWKWALWIGLRGPIMLAAFLLVGAVSGIVSRIYLMSGNVIVFLLALRPQLSAFLVEIGWLILWLELMHTNYKDAYHTGGFFQHVYVAVYKFIVLLAIWRGFAVARYAFKRWLSLKFYHSAHYKDMMDALVQEHILMLLTQPGGAGVGRHPKVAGWPNAHFEALRFVTHVLRGTRFQKLLDQDRLDALVIRLQDIRGRLVRSLAKRIEQKRKEGLEDDAVAMQEMLDSAVQDAALPADINVFRVAMVRQMGLKWKARAVHSERDAADLTREMQEKAFQTLLERKAQGERVGDKRRRLSSWASLGSLGTPDADVMKGATRMTWIEDQIRHKTLQVSYISDTHGGVGHKTSLKNYRDNNAESKIDTSLEAQKLGYYLFWHLKADVDSLEITADDIDRVISSKTSESLAAWRMLDRDGNGAVSLSELVDRIVEIYRKRKNLAKTLLDTETVVKQCFAAIRIVADVIIMFIALALYDTAKFASTWAALSATLLSFSFVFGNSIKVLWENAIYLFTHHSFTVGDQIRFGTVGTSIAGDIYIVKKITLNFLHLERLGNMDIIMPMDQLRTLAIHNITRSGEKWDSFVVNVDMDTTLERLKPVALVIKQHIAAHPKLFGGFYRIFFTNATVAYKLELTVAFNYCHNGTDLFGASIAKSGLFNVLAKALRDAGVEFTLPHQKGMQNMSRDDDADLLPTRVDYATAAGVPPKKPAAGGAAATPGNALMLAAGGVAALSAL